MDKINWINNYDLGFACPVASLPLAAIMSHWTRSFYVVLVTPLARLFFMNKGDAIRNRLAGMAIKSIFNKKTGA